jgi:NAD(P)-dependent dehydrogenase (short-subunit alcohol dehydrogenase family)
MAGRLAGKVAIITGGAGGIGSATGQLFAEEGVRVVLVDRDAAALAAVAERIGAAVPRAALVARVEDVGEETAAARIVEAAVTAFGRIDVVVNNAGIRANAVCPGLTLTPFHMRRAEAAGRTRQELDDAAKGGCLAGRWAEPREIAYPILWLASDEASYVTASTLMVDGGRFVL